jgi:nucleotide-binding universal stress UspA family protein
MPDKTPAFSIVVAIDYSETSNLALERAFELASEKPGAELHVVNVLSPYESRFSPEVSASALAQAAAELQNHLRARTAAYREKNDAKGVVFVDRIVAHQRAFSPAEEIAQLAADLEADLVVIGTHGRRGVSRALLGSVAETTVRLAPCPVLVVRPKALPVSLPAIAPPCPRCVEERKATKGAEFWCEQHRERHGQRHTYHQGDRVGADTNLPLTLR